MATNLKKMKSPKKDYGRVEDGTYPVRIVQAIMLGVQLQTDWQTNEAKVDKEGNLVYLPEVWITYEFPTERVKYMNDKEEEVDRPRWQSKTYTLSMGKKANFLKVMNAFAGPEAETLEELLGKPGIVTVESTSGGKAKITNVAPPMKGMEVGPLENETSLYDLDEPDEEVFDSLPDFLQEKIRTRQKDDEDDEAPAPVDDIPEEGEDPFAE